MSAGYTHSFHFEVHIFFLPRFYVVLILGAAKMFHRYQTKLNSAACARIACSSERASFQTLARIKLEIHFNSFSQFVCFKRPYRGYARAILSSSPLPPTFFYSFSSHFGCCCWCLFFFILAVAELDAGHTNWF